MRTKAMLLSIVGTLLWTACAGGGSGSSFSPGTQTSTGTTGSETNTSNSSGTSSAGTKTSTGYTLLAWSELGMHCMDGKDYSVFSVLPPYNTIHAQLFKKGEPPQRVDTGITITYEAMADATGSINTISSTKTNFWSYVKALFGASVAPDVGLTGLATQNKTPVPLKFDSAHGNWIAEGIPTVPYDDKMAKNAYPMAKVVARNSKGTVLASATVVLAVSDEMSCSTCHASGSNASAKPAAGWVNNSDPAKDVKLNILRLHDENVDISGMLPTLKTAGYDYKSKLYDTANSGTPILCAACHKSNALGTSGISPATQLTTAMHNKHASVVNPSTGTTLDNATSPTQSCYLCHPGQNTKCQRGAMNKTACYDCHGNLTAVGTSTRMGWMDLPSCQNCHANGNRYTTTFSSPGVWRDTGDTRFATQMNVPISGKDLYRYSQGHGTAYCSGCHGSPHAEYPTLQANDNVYSTTLQGHAGKIDDCTVCHTNLPVSLNGGPHGLHNIGQSWVTAHHDYAKSNLASCATCHGADYRGSPLAKTSVARNFTVDDGRTKSYTAGQMVTCYDCHNGPYGD